MSASNAALPPDDVPTCGQVTIRGRIQLYGLKGRKTGEGSEKVRRCKE